MNSLKYDDWQAVKCSYADCALGWAVIPLDIWNRRAALTRLRAQTVEECARVCERRAERRFEEHGYTEPDTNAGYYVGEYKDLGESLDEEDSDCATAIRALLVEEKP